MKIEFEVSRKQAEMLYTVLERIAPDELIPDAPATQLEELERALTPIILALGDVAEPEPEPPSPRM